MDKTIRKELDELSRKLEVIIILLAGSALVGDNLPLKEQIQVLDNYGLRIPEIAKALNKKPGHISKELSLIRRGK